MSETNANPVLDLDRTVRLCGVSISPGHNYRGHRIKLLHTVRGVGFVLREEAQA